MILNKLIVLILFLMSFVVKAQEVTCGNTFQSISKECVSSKSKDFVDRPISISRGSRDQIYFLKTMMNQFVKIKVNSVYQSKTECTVYLDIGVFNQERIISNSKVLSIQQSFGTWGKDQIALNDGAIQSDLLLENRNGKCALITMSGQVYKYKKINNRNKFEGSSILYYSSLFLIFLAIFLIAQTIFYDDDKYRAQERLEDAEEINRESKVTKDIILKYSKPFFKRYFSPVVGGMKNKKWFKNKYRRQLASSGLNKELTSEDFFAFKLFLIIGFPVIFLALRSFLETDWPISLTPFMAVLGFFYPDLWINGKIKNRQEEIIRAMPFVVDMLALSVEAGLDFMAAMVKVIEKAPPSPLTEEFEILIKDTRLGASRAEGLRQMAWRVDVIQISSFCATLIAADSVGASVGPILKALSAEMRQKRSADAEKKGATAATKILFPMIMLILPAVVIIIGLPFILEFVG